MIISELRAGVLRFMENRRTEKFSGPFLIDCLHVRLGAPDATTPAFRLVHSAARNLSTLCNKSAVASASYEGSELSAK